MYFIIYIISAGVCIRATPPGVRLIWSLSYCSIRLAVLLDPYTYFIHYRTTCIDVTESSPDVYREYLDGWMD